MDTAITAGAEPVTATAADSFVVVSLWRAKEGEAGGDMYEYEAQPTLNAALDLLREYEDGEYPRARAVGIFAARNGLPTGGALNPSLLLRLMRETRAA
jgi:hypothetical protein